ncbi:RWD domain-containing protein 2B-like [Nerophis ophidion]|uniref:RWD domain-containing protein 2B-like n=1 Tax=Nerophis ophidion TaxID=159077 RepID=UPI002ADF358D|nr:RWD domain-containing protein 2B-like [Nerophis ophidion]XP_061733943.1 RWD domain-containing protein 2B-like [Nerophis ophidion]
MSLQEWAAAQLAELELLGSMFPTRDELEMLDQLALAELRDYVDGSSPPPSCRAQFVIRQRMQDMDFHMSCTFPPQYPSVIPEITVTSPGLGRAQQTRLQAGLRAYLTEVCLGEVCVLSAADWLRDNLRAFLSETASPAPPESHASPPREAFSRLWIYSHHIYNSTKRKNILEWAKELGLTGFSMPGKPGIVCVEGAQSACEDFWSRVKVLTWKRIAIRHREDVSPSDEGALPSVDSLRKFSGFQEAVFDPRGPRGNHMDLGLLYQFLQERGCCHVFQMYFGVEGR